MNTAPLDGNATAGMLSEVFTFEVTMARTTCAGCGATSSVAELRAYTRAAGMVLRCASCDAVQVRLVRSPDRAWLDLTGVKVLEMPMADGS